MFSARLNDDLSLNLALLFLLLTTNNSFYTFMSSSGDTVDLAG
jgi:hypothetical protein